LDDNTWGIVTPDNVYHAGLQSSLGMLSGPLFPVALIESGSNYPATVTLLKTNGGLTAPAGYNNIAV
jgi:hypothetical protein